MPPPTIGVPPSVRLLWDEAVIAKFVGVLPAWSLRVAAGEGTLRGAGEECARWEGVEMFWAAVVGRFEWDGVGVDIVVVLL